MMQPILVALKPGIKVANIVISVGSKGWLLATEWLVTIGIPASAFNFIHHVLAIFGLFSFMIQAQLTDTPLFTLDNTFQMLFVVLSMAMFEVTRQTDPGFLSQEPGQPSTSHPGSFHVCDSCHATQIYRSFHCRKCNRCVERFDHHSFWTNCCIGARNLRYFVALVSISLLAIASVGLQCFYTLMLSTELLSRLFWTSAVAFNALLFYSLSAFFITLFSGMIVNVSAAEMRGKIHNANEYLTIIPYFNAFDHGTDYNTRACLNGYTAERPAWSEPTRLQKLIATLVATKGACGSGSSSCDHGPGAHSHNHSKDSHAKPAPAHSTGSNASSSSRQTSQPVGDNNV